MKNTTTKFWIETKKEDSKVAIVSYDDKNNYSFLIRSKAEKFLARIIKQNPTRQFRVVTCKLEYYRSDWNIPQKKTSDNVSPTKV